MVADLIF